jgi:hypothetical protein
MARLPPKTHRLLVQARATWQSLVPTQSLGELQQGEPPAAIKPQLVPSHAGVWQLLPDPQSVHIAPQLCTLRLSLQVPPQS